jgi:hypothetical protein
MARVENPQRRHVAATHVMFDPIARFARLEVQPI